MTKEMTTVKQEILSLVSDINRPGIPAFGMMSTYVTGKVHNNLPNLNQQVASSQSPCAS
ncbi:MAG: hypothetical protein IJ190_04940 [Prevotella sp.]|nr:hypothetical protein [Prevotella sp.]